MSNFGSILSEHKIIGGPTTGKRSLYFGSSFVPLPEEERLMFLNWILFTYPEDAGKVEHLPTSLLREMYPDLAPGGEDWDTFRQLTKFIREAEDNVTKASQVKALVMEYRDFSDYTYLKPVTFFSNAVASEHSLHGILKGNLAKTITGVYTYADLTATIWYIAKQIMIVRDPDMKSALIQRIETL